MAAAIIGRLLSGTSLFLVNNQLVSGVTAIVKGNVARASASWEVFNSAGQAVGAYIGVTLVGKLGFGHMMLSGATAYLLMVIVTHMAWPGKEDMVDEEGDEERGSTFRLYVSRPAVVYGWLNFLVIGGTMVFVEGMLSQFLFISYSKPLQFSSLVLGVSGALYTFCACVMGYVGTLSPSIPPITLIIGLFETGICLVFLGPFINFGGIDNLTLSLVSFYLILVGSSAIQLNGITVTADKLRASPRVSMTTAMNVTNVAYNVGATLIPLAGSVIVDFCGYPVAFAAGAPLMWGVGVVVLTQYMCRG